MRVSLSLLATVPTAHQPSQRVVAPARRISIVMAASGRQAQPEPTINFDRVTDSIVVGSCLRNAADADKAQQAGVAVVFSLQDETDLSNQKIDAAGVAADCQQAGMKHVRCPTSDADEEELRRLLPAAVAAFAREVQAASGSDGSAYIHCNGGRGRAPTVVVAYLYWLCNQCLGEAVATMTTGRSSQPKLPVIEAATADLLGQMAGDELTAEQRAVLAGKLQEL